MEFDFNLKALKLIGVLLQTDTTPSLLYRVWNVIIFIQHLVIHSLVLVNFLAGLTPSMYARVASSYQLLIGSITIFRRLYFIIKRTEVQRLIALIEGISEHSDENHRQLKRKKDVMKQQSARNIRRFSIFLFAYIIGMILALLISFMLFRTIAILLQNSLNTNIQTNKKQRTVHRLVLYIMWWPTNIRETPTYYFIVLWHCISAIYTLAFLSITDAFTCSLLLAASARAKFLAESASRALLPRPRNNTNKMSPSLLSWLRNHQRYIAMMEQLNTLTGPLIFSSHLMALITCIALSYIIVKVNDNVMAALGTVLNLGGLIQLAIMSYAGQKVIDTSLQLSRSIVSVSQIEGGLLTTRGTHKSALQVLFTRISVCNDQSSRVSGLGFFTVSMEFFSTVLSASMTYLLFLLQFKAGGPNVTLEL